MSPHKVETFTRPPGGRDSTGIAIQGLKPLATITRPPGGGEYAVMGAGTSAGV